MRWTNREVRNLLRLMRRPHHLDRERLIVMLRECMHANSGREALLVAIDEAFDLSDAHQRLRYESIQRVDVAGETTHAAATAMNVSVRQFFRYRYEAIASIALSIERILRRPPDSHRHLLRLAKAIETIDPKAAREIYLRIPTSYGGQVAYNIVRTTLWSGEQVTKEQLDACEGSWRLLAEAAVARQLIAQGRDDASAALRRELQSRLAGESGPLYDAVAFELAAQDILDAHRRGDVTRSGIVTRTVRTMASANEYLLAFAMTIEAQQFIIEGDLPAAALVLTDLDALEAPNHDHYIMARAAYCNAMLSLVRGFHEDAFVIANGARPAITALEAGFGFRAATIAGRAALLAGVAWKPPRDLIEKYPRLWTAPETEAVYARHLLASDLVAAQALAERTLHDARQHESVLVAAAAEAVLAAVCDMRGQTADAQSLWLKVWQTALACGDKFALYDLLVIPSAPRHDIGPLHLDDRLLDIVQNHLEDNLPIYGLTRASGLHDVSRALLRTAILAGLGAPQPALLVVEQARRAAAGLARANPTLDRLRRVAVAAESIISSATSVLLPPHERTAYTKRLHDQWSSVMDVMQTRVTQESASLRA